MESGVSCPICGKEAAWLSTTNPWQYACSTGMHGKNACDIRFTRHGDIRPGDYPKGQS